MTDTANTESLALIVEDNQINRFIEDPKPFTVENVRPYMSKFTVGETLNQFLGR